MTSNSQELQPNIDTEKDAEKDIEQEGATNAGAKPNAKEVLDNLELTIAFFDNVSYRDSYSLMYDLVDEYIALSEDDIAAGLQEAEQLCIDIIQGGEAFLLEKRKEIIESTELTKNEKKKQPDKLFKRAEIAHCKRRSVRARAMSGLIENFTNPYLWTEQGMGALNYSHEYETGTTLSEWTGKYKSNWTPDVHFSKRDSKFFSEDDIKQIRSFIENYFEKHKKVSKIQADVARVLGRPIRTDGYDPSAAEVIVEKAKGEDFQFGERTRVIIGTHSISIVLSAADYSSVRGKDEYLHNSGGFHMSGTVFNFANDDFFNDVSGTIDHEDEHSLNDILIGVHVNDLSKEQMLYLLSQSGKEEYTDKELEQLEDDYIGSMLRVALNNEFFVNRFVDEALAHKLGSNRDNRSVLRLLNEGALYYYLNTTQENIDKAVSGATWSVSLALDVSNNIKYAHKNGLISEQVRKSFANINSSRIRKVAQELLSKKNIEKDRENMLVQIDRLLCGGFKKEQVRALLSANSPYEWKSIVDEALNPARIELKSSDIRHELRQAALAGVERAVDLAEKDPTKNSSIPEEEKAGLASTQELVEKLKNDGFPVVKEQYHKGSAERAFIYLLRKVDGDNVYSVQIIKQIMQKEEGEIIKNRFRIKASTPDVTRPEESNFEIEGELSAEVGLQRVSEELEFLKKQLSI